MKRRICVLFVVFTLILTILPTQAFAATIPPAGRVTTASTGLNIRSAASTASTIIGKLSKGATVTLLSQSGNWYKVQYGTTAIGYCSADFITPLTNSKKMTVAITDGVLNIRSGAGTNYAIQSTLTKGSQVIRLSTTGNWSRILYNGTNIGYVSSTYLSETTAPSVSTGSVSLKVPKYLQTDSRWSHVKLGNSSATIGKSGCATTSLAMTESYRLGVTKTPAQMAKTLSYTSSGSVYWPSHYAQTTNSANYLTFIYNQLKSGKPVILGLKSNQNSMHFVVITGCNGSTASAANFTVNDPGSSGRTKLSQVLSVYPNFYKMLWVK